MDMFASGAQIFKDLGILESMIFSMLVAILGGGWYYISRIYPRRLETEEKREALRLEIEDRKEKKQTATNDMLRESVNHQRELLSNNTKAIEHLGTSLELLNQTFEKVSDRLSSHDERSVHITTLLRAQSESISNLSERVASNDALVRVHDRIDEMTKGLAEKEDIVQLQTAIHQVNQGIARNTDKLIELTTKL